MLKRLFTFSCIAAVLALVLCSCSASGGEKVSMYDLKTAMVSATEKFTDMKYVSDEDDDAENIFKNISDMRYSMVDGFFVYYASNGTHNADEIAVIQVRKTGDLTAARKSLEAHLEKRKSLYATYDKTQLKKLGMANVAVHGNCAVLVVADDVSSLIDAFHNFFDGE